MRQRNRSREQRDEQLRRFVQYAPVALAMLDRNMRYLAASGRWLEVYGLEARNLNGGCHYDVFPEIPQRWKDVHQRCLQGAVEQCHEDRLERADGSVQWVHWEVRPWFAGDGSIGGIVITSEDITARKKAEESLQQTVQDLARSNRDLEQFAYAASHDLKEPLRMVTGFMTLLRERLHGLGDRTVSESIELATEAASRMQTLMDDLLAYSKVGRDRTREKADAAAAVKTAIQNLQAMVRESDARITFQDLPIVQANPVELTQLFQNLIGNAIKFRGGRVPEISLAAEPEAQQWHFTVRDNGIGIDPRYSDKVFLIFQRLHTDPRIEGSGIGLAICKKIIETHGGRIWLESAVGSGTTFHFTLPQNHDSA